MNNELMWATYANYHRGICLGFDASDPFFEGIQPVQYVDAPTTETITSKASETLLDPWSLCKSKAWEFQKEWRLVLPGDEPKRVGFPKEALKVVVLGYRFTEHDYARLKGRFSSKGDTAFKSFALNVCSALLSWRIFTLEKSLGGAKRRRTRQTNPQDAERMSHLHLNIFPNQPARRRNFGGRPAVRFQGRHARIT